jgi:hypothetical protein
MINVDKEKLDKILEKNKSQPVGSGYIDIIVSRKDYVNFIRDLVENGFDIDCLTWWEWCPSEQKNKYGLGGPKSKYYNGWYAELPIEPDNFDFSIDLDSEERIKEIVNRIDTKTISYPKGIFTFNKDEWMTPAIWLNVPDDWENKYYA